MAIHSMSLSSCNCVDFITDTILPWLIPGMSQLE